MRLGLREANQQFAKAIRAVRSGKRVVLTDRGRPIAVIERVTEEADERATLTSMAEEGVITPAARRGPTPAPRWRPAIVEGTPLSRSIIDDRDED